MGNPWENSTADQKEQKESEGQSFDAIKRSLKHRIGNEIPEDQEELFRNYDKYVPKDFEPFFLASDPPRQMTREAIKNALERNLYGATMQEVENYFSGQMDQLSTKSDEMLRIMGGKDTDELRRLDKQKDEITDLFNQLGNKNLEFPLAYIELKIGDIHTQELEKTELRKFAERLSAEINKDKPKNEINASEVRKKLEDIEKSRLSIVGDDEEEREHFKKIYECFDSGNYELALKEIEFTINGIWLWLNDRKNKDLKDNAEKVLKERYGAIFMPAVTMELDKLRSCRKFIISQK